MNTSHATNVAAEVFDMSLGRLGATVAALLALTGVLVGGRALARSRPRTGTAAATDRGRHGAVVALVAGLTGTALGTLVAMTASGGLGTGNGLGGALVALVVGLTSTALGGLALARSRRTRVTAERRPADPAGRLRHVTSSRLKNER